MSKINIGFCGVCETSLVGGNSAEFTFILSDSVIYRHAICKKCINELDQAKVTALIGRIKEYWIDSMVGWATEKQFQKVRALELQAFHLEEEKAKLIFKDFEKEKFATHLKEVKKQKNIAEKLGETLSA